MAAKKGSKATPKKAASKGSALPAVPKKAPAALTKAGVVRITGRTEPKRRINYDLVKRVVMKGESPADAGKAHGIGAAQVRRIVALAKNELDGDRFPRANAHTF